MPIKSTHLNSYFASVTSFIKKNSKRLLGGRFHKLKKVLLLLTAAIIILVAVVILFISPITKYLVEKYDLKYTGRQITMDWAYVNPFTGYIHFDNVKIYELKSDSTFLSVRGVSANVSMRKLLFKTYEITNLTLNRPTGIVIQSKKILNFTDLIEKFSSKADSLVKAVPVHFSILSIHIIDGEFHYRETVTPINYFITKVNIESTGVHWDADTVAAKFSFVSGIGSGSMNGNFTINTNTLEYRLAVKALKFDLNILEQYLKDLTNYGYFSANIDADLNVNGNFEAAENVTFSGLLAINEFHAGETRKEDYASFEKLTLAIFELSPKNHKYLFDSVSLSSPYFKFEQYDYSSNLQKMFGAGGMNATGAAANTDKFNLVLVIGNYIKDLTKNFFRSNYKLNKLAIYNGNLAYNDYSLSEKFAIELDNMTVLADSLTKNKKRVNLYFTSAIKPYGNAKFTLSINPNDSSDFDLQYQLQKMPASMFNPYAITYTSFPFNRGTIELTGSWHVRNGNIQSNNHLLLIDPRLSKRIKNNDIKWIPAPLIMAFVRERGNVIDYEVPITGDLKNPKFHLHDAIIDVLGNIFVKPATTAYRMEVKDLETEIEKSLTIKWNMRKSSLKPQQERFIERMADFLAKNPEASISVSPQQFAVKEKEYILFFEAKKKYYLEKNHIKEASFSEKDEEDVEKMSVKDSMFVRYLNAHTSDSMLFTIQDKCGRFVGGASVDAKYKQLNRERENAFMAFFKERDVAKRVIVSGGQTVIPYNGFSYYKLDYNGDYPNSLIKAYRKMNDLNDEAPRNLFKTERGKIKGKL